MTLAPQTVFPNLNDIMDLARSVVNDMYPGVGGTRGRILTNDAPFTAPYINSTLRTIQRKLRNEGVTWPIKDNVILTNMTPVVAADPSVNVYISYNGYFDGTTMHSDPHLPLDLIQPQLVWEQTAGSNLPFVLMEPLQSGMPSVIQGPWLGVWKWENYALYMPGSTATKNIRLRYTSGLPSLNAPAADFGTTPVMIVDCQEAMAFGIARLYALARGAGDISQLSAMFDEAIDDMATEWVRQMQNATYRRLAYGDGGSDRDGGYPTGQVVVA